jgi:PAS domain S-box-containing protein
MQVAAREGRTVEREELDIVRSDGMRLRLLEYAAPLFDSEGLPRGSVGAFIDISERTAAEARQNFIMRLNDSLRPLIDPEEIVAMSAKLLGEYLDVDRCAYAQVEPDEDTMLLTGNYLRGTKSIVGVLRFSDFGPEVQRLMRANEPYIVEDVEVDVPETHRAAYKATQIRAVICVPLHKAGKFVAAMAVHQVHPRTWSADQVALVQMVANRCWEALERARVTRELRQSEERLRSVLETTPECVTIILPDGELEYVNSAGASILGFRDEAVAIGQSFADLVVPESREEWLRRHQSILRGERPTWEFEILSLRGERRWLEAHAVPFREADGTIKHLAVSREISGRKRLERQREELLEQERAARAEAERVNRMKDEFLATLSHELRTPLNAILGWAQLLSRQKRSEAEDRQGLDAIERNARAQRQIIEDLLDMNRIVSGKIRLDVRTVALDEVLLAAVDAVRPILHAKLLHLTHHIDPHRALVSGDANRLQQVFWNLLTNAAKFTPTGGRILVEVERKEPLVEVRVSDTGQGIKSDFLPHVFERFRQEDSSLTRNQGGLGLGLSIVRSLVEIHGGTVHAKSAGEGQGASFVVTLPIAHASSGRRPMEVAPSSLHDAQTVDVGHFDLSGIQALVVDDDGDARGIVERLLQDCGATVALAASGDEALRSLGTVRPNLLISDIGMPRMDGYELLNRVREFPDEALRKIPAIALTAFARAEDRTRALESGYQAYVPKPLDPAELLRVCSQLKEQCCAGRHAATAAAANT